MEMVFALRMLVDIPAEQGSILNIDESMPYEVCDGPRLRPTSYKTVSKNTLWEKTLRISFSKTSKLEKKSKCLCFQIQNLGHVVCLKNISLHFATAKGKGF